MKKTRIKSTCQHCQKTFEMHLYRLAKGTGKYCGQACYLAARWKRTPACERCGKDCQHRFCSDECRNAHWAEHSHAVHKHPGNWKRKLALIKDLGGKCESCGIDDYRVLDIDHIDPTKKLRFKQGRVWSYRFKDWAANAGNLRLLCANCHRLRTWAQMGHGPRSLE